MTPRKPNLPRPTEFELAILPSGSRPTFVGEDTGLSGTRGSISTRLHQSSSTEERAWIAPEIPVPSRASDWLAGRDAALEAVLAVIRGKD